MNDFYQLLKELIQLQKINPKTRKRIKIIALIILLFSILFFTIKNNFFNKESKELIIDVNNSENTIVTTGKQNNIIQNISTEFFVRNDTNIKEIIEEYLNNPDVSYDYYTIKKVGYKPYYLVVFYQSDSIYFESFKIKDEKIIIINRLKTRDIEFNVSTRKFASLMDNEYLLYSGCKPHACNLEYGIYVYSLKYDEGYAVSTNGTTGFTIVNLPKKINVMHDFENIMLSQWAELKNKTQENCSIIDYLPSRKLPNLIDSVNNKNKILMNVKRMIQDTLSNPQIISKLEIFGIYRENFFNNGLCWLSASAINNNSSDYVIFTFLNDNLEVISSLRSSYLTGDTGDIYIIKQEKNNQKKSDYLMIVKDCGGNSGMQDVWLYKIETNKLQKSNNKSLTKNFLKQFEIDNYYIN